jgi:hypothetical protein
MYMKTQPPCTESAGNVVAEATGRLKVAFGLKPVETFEPGVLSKLKFDLC